LRQYSSDYVQVIVEGNLVGQSSFVLNVGVLRADQRGADSQAELEKFLGGELDLASIDAARKLTHVRIRQPSNVVATPIDHALVHQCALVSFCLSNLQRQIEERHQYGDPANKTANGRKV